ncbi:sciellin-like, partial [Leptonychotes weddellii]|uniref:Sciellin-like n=1 Tax=Leptonychotes weddellii TaxID=9713 RepID=A0A7F8QBV3_LEPWE
MWYFGFGWVDMKKVQVLGSRPKALLHVLTFPSCLYFQVCCTKDENYGRVVLNRRNSHDALDRKANERDEPKAMISRYGSDDTLDRISDRNDAAKTHKANTLDNRLTNRNMSTFRSPEVTKMQPGVSFNDSTTSTPAPTSATTPVKKKRQSWFPPPPPGYSTTPSTGASR